MNSATVFKSYILVVFHQRHYRVAWADEAVGGAFVDTEAQAEEARHHIVYSFKNRLSHCNPKQFTTLKCMQISKEILSLCIQGGPKKTGPFLRVDNF